MRTRNFWLLDKNIFAFCDTDLYISEIPKMGSLQQDFSTSVLTFWEWFFVAEEGAVLYIVGCLAAALPFTH